MKEHARARTGLIVWLLILQIGDYAAGRVAEDVQRQITERHVAEQSNKILKNFASWFNVNNDKDFTAADAFGKAQGKHAKAVRILESSQAAVENARFALYASASAVALALLPISSLAVLILTLWSIAGATLAGFFIWLAVII